ncbi:patellin-3 [Juglans regia]|uniref:Patellin-3 n=2 Tax=Juglans regia TaxID=51240 RepID=A0A2I4FPN4_JUGRE|nr:patellin-3 [Juglans regia]
MADETPNPPPPLSPATSDRPTDIDHSPAPVSVVVTESESLSVTESECEQPTTPPVAESGSLVVVDEKEDLPPRPPSVAVLVEVQNSATQEGVGVVEAEKPKPNEDKKIPQSLVSFKEESNVVADLSDSERKSLQELRQLVQEALDSNRFTFSPPPPKGAEKQGSAQEAPVKLENASAVPSEPTPRIEENPEKEAQEVAKETEQLSIWGVPLLKDDRTDVILLKFLRARDFKVKDAFVMIRNTIKWRKEFGIDALVDEDLGDEWEKVVFMHGYDREGHPVCYNVYGEFQNKEVYAKAFSDEEKRAKFLRWRIQFLERSIRKLDFSPGGVCTIFQVNDLKNSPGPAKRDLRLATKQALQVLQDNYPEFVAKQVFINVPWWYLAFYTMISPFLTQRTKSKFVFAGPSKTAETLFKYISPEQVPVHYGGLSVDYCDCNPDFSTSDPVAEVTVKPATKQTVEIIIYEKCSIVWELRVVGWEVSYGAEFVPTAEDRYTVIIQKATKKAPSDEPVVSNSFKVGELGKILLTVDNPTSKKKQLLYRFKIKSFID